MKEIWKDIEGYEEFYRASNLGKIKSLERRVTCRDGKIKPIKEKILKYSLNGQGYRQVVLSKNGKKAFTVHRLVALHFIDNPENKPTVNHKWGDKLDNRSVALEWATYAENTQHAFRIGLMKGINAGKYGSNHTRSIAVLQYSKNGNYIAEYGSQIDASLKTGIHKQCIHQACRGKIKTSGGFIWKVKL